MDQTFWARACNAARGRPLSDLKESNDVFHGVAVSIFRSHTFTLLVHASFRSHWRLNGKEVDGDSIWRNLRAFSGRMSTGCFAGVVAFSLRP